MMDSITDESSPHLHSNLTLLIVINIISVSSLSYRSEPVSCPQSAGPTGASPSPGQSVASTQGTDDGDGAWVWGLGSAGWPASC